MAQKIVQAKFTPSHGRPRFPEIHQKPKSTLQKGRTRARRSQRAFTGVALPKAQSQADIYNDMSCYQWALYGGDNAQMLTDVGNRFVEVGNYIIGAADPAETNPAFAAIDAAADAYLDRPNTEASRQLYLRAILYHCLQATPGVQLNATGGTRIYGVFQDGSPTPTHMWVHHNGRLYDTMPDRTLRNVAANANSNNPGWVDGNEPLGQMACISIDGGLSAGQQAATQVPGLWG